MSQEESVPMPRGWTCGAAWKGAGASLLLHLIVGAGVIVALSGPPRPAPQGIDLTLLPPAGIDRRPVPSPFAAAEPATVRERTVLPGPPALPAAPTFANPPDGTTPANPPDGTAPANPSDPAANGIAPGSPHPPAAASPTTGQDTAIKETAGSPSGTSGAGSPPAADFAWIRDAIQGAIAYPSTARRMGWEGKVVVAFHLLSDGSVRDVRVLQGSGHAALDRGAIDAVRSASPFPRSPVEAEVITPVVYRLTTR
ncbi:TonB family protein [Candidatus Deferrimicrobium sp.]|uniref:energy transducer TonB n=1 Tax=Candidatus Deferrimicrobium sp. TaxID=3060586 RepID=UPI003C691927